MRGNSARLIVIAAGGTAGHIFPAFALSDELAARGHPVVLMTDARTINRAGGSFTERLSIQGAGIAGRGFSRAAAAIAALARGTLQARRELARMKPAALVGFGGYPAVAPVLAARSLRIPAILHEQNAVLGRANRLLARFASAIALSFATTKHAPASAIVTGNPVRAEITPRPYAAPEDTLRILVLGGSLGARVMSEAVPQALVALSRPVTVVQQCREEDLDRVKSVYAAAGIQADLATFIADVPARLAASHLVIARAGASTVAELTVAGRPAILIPLPNAIDGHQLANAEAIGATVLQEPVTPDALKAAITELLPRLPEAAAAIATHGRPHAAATLADLTEHYIAGKVSL
jgi:UDP-N-acetylglucosamine--N-acetylmuramyl-(pentapeptide) pyrophosphoryl-undecaprenol N-acetylglucosamine transferase